MMAYRGRKYYRDGPHLFSNAKLQRLRAAEQWLVSESGEDFPLEAEEMISD